MPGAAGGRRRFLPALLSSSRSSATPQPLHAMAEPMWQQILTRAQQTTAVWGEHAPTFALRGLTRAQHQADAAALAPAAQAVADAQDLLDDARAARDTVIAQVQEMAVRMPRKLDGDLLPNDPFHRDLEDIRSGRYDGLGGTIARGQRVIALWKKLNARNAAATPVIPALTVGGVALATFTTWVESLPALQQAVEDAQSPLRDRRRDLRTLAERVDEGNKRWFAAWQGEFPPGTPEGDALGQITTEGSGGGGDSGSGGNGGGPAPAPTLPGAAEIIGIGTNGNGDVFFDMAALGAVSFDIWRKGPGDEEFVLHATAFPGTHFEQLSMPPGEYQWRIAGRNAAGLGPQSEPSTITVAG